jgi:tubulin polyglutamylase TTLL4
MCKFQKTNHFPGCWQLGRKDCMYRNLASLKRKHPKDFEFVPNTYILSSDYDRFKAARDSAPNNSIWILKPCDQACGRGIRIINKKSKIKYKKNYLVSEYISNPHLINGYKYDLRIYILVNSYDPLKIYMFENGLVRFATEKYSNKTITKRYIHLTNYSVNKNNVNIKNLTKGIIYRTYELARWRGIKMVFKSFKEQILRVGN